MIDPTHAVPEVWAGIECTLNRTGPVYQSQCARNGHLNRLSDLDLIASLGVKKLRYPILWEHLAPENPDQIDWTWADERLNRLRELNIEPIVTLVHHGSGPAYATFETEAFVPGLAAFAKAVAQRYPWLRYFTPVNEPLTTARFAGLYGIWYPHQSNSQSFARIFINQCRGIKAAMQAIREIIPEAQLVQTEDLGYTHSTPRLQYQADFENHRRWLTFDLLCGKVTEQHPLWSDLLAFGLSIKELQEFQHQPCPPNIIGINHYVTSERYLDQRYNSYPRHTQGGNAWHKYADAEAVRAASIKPKGPEFLLREVWQLYQRPFALTEVHMGCSRAEQLRWANQLWQTSCRLVQDGAPLVGFTFWSLFGTYDWDTLLTQQNNRYESGVFDLRAPNPRATALARMAEKLANTGQFTHPVLDTPGWWQRSNRFQYRKKSMAGSFERLIGPPAKPLLITGATGTLGRAFARICEEQGLEFRLLNRAEMDIADPESVTKALQQYKPWAVINTAGYVRVEQAETEPEACFRENALGPVVLAKACADANCKLVTFSSDLVFSGRAGAIFTESAAVNPANVYGQSKARAEELVLAQNPAALVIRTSAFFGPWDSHNFVYHVLRSLLEGQLFSAASDSEIAPTYVPDLVKATLDLLVDNECGIWHLANKGVVTWAGLARKVAVLAGLDPQLIQEVKTEDLDLTAAHPGSTALESEKAWLMPELGVALAHAVTAILQRIQHENHMQLQKQNAELVRPESA